LWHAEGVSDERAPEDPKEAALRKVRRFVETYTAKGKYGLYPVEGVVENVVEGLAENLVAHGRMYCPCADVEDSKTKGSAMVCPCTPHHEDITRQGYCDCALFASRDFVAAERLRKGK
jgi:ferredoxin-thioredoxin reductase catalytic subunit